MSRTLTGFNNKTKSRVNSGTLKVVVNPAVPIFQNTVLLPGSVVKGNKKISVSNGGNLALRYWIFADWKAIPPTTPLEALLAARLTQVLIIKPVLPPLVIYRGPLKELFDQPRKGRYLDPLGKETMQFLLLLPKSAAGFPLDAGLKVDFLFVAESVSGSAC